LKVEIPVNTSATIKLPVSKDSEIKVNKKAVKAGFHEKEKKPTLELGSGIYTIECKT